MSEKKPTLIETRRWWALVRGPRELPVVFGSRQEAEENCDTDEYVVQISVRASNDRNRFPQWALGKTARELRQVASEIDRRQHGKRLSEYGGGSD